MSSPPRKRIRGQGQTPPHSPGVNSSTGYQEDYSNSVEDELERSHAPPRPSLGFKRSSIATINQSAEFQCFLMKLSDNIHKETFMKLKHWYRRDIGIRIVENLEEPLHLLNTLLEHGKIQNGNPEQLVEVFKGVGRKDLADTVTDYLKQKAIPHTADRDKYFSFTKQEITTLAVHLRERYRTRVAKFQPLTWNERLLLNLDDMYTKLLVINEVWSTRSDAGRPLQDIISIFKNTSRHTSQRISIEGAPAIGKSIFCRKLAMEWVNGKLEQFKLLILVEMRYVRDQSLEEYILDRLLPEDTHFEKHELSHVLKLNADSVLFVFDGLDEFDPQVKSSSDVCKIISRKLLSQSTVLVTSRPHECDVDLKHCDDRFTIKGFTFDYVKEYITRHFESQTNTADDLIKKLSQYEGMEDGFLSVPLHVVFICLLFEDWQKGKEFPKTKANLYTEILKCFLKRYCVKNSIELSFEKIPQNVENLVAQLSQLAFEALKESKNSIKENSIESSTLLSLGLFVKDRGSFKTEPVKECQFYHKTWQEFFCAKYLFDNVDRSDIQSRFEELLRNQRGAAMWLNMFTFLFELSCGTDKAEKVFKIYDDAALRIVKEERNFMLSYFYFALMAEHLQTCENIEMYLPLVSEITPRRIRLENEQNRDGRPRDIKRNKSKEGNIGESSSRGKFNPADIKTAVSKSQKFLGHGDVFDELTRSLFLPLAFPDDMFNVVSMTKYEIVFQLLEYRVKQQKRKNKQLPDVQFQFVNPEPHVLEKLSEIVHRLNLKSLTIQSKVDPDIMRQFIKCIHRAPELEKLAFCMIHDEGEMDIAPTQALLHSLVNEVDRNKTISEFSILLHDAKSSINMLPYKLLDDERLKKITLAVNCAGTTPKEYEALAHYIHNLKFTKQLKVILGVEQDVPQSLVAETISNPSVNLESYGCHVISVHDKPFWSCEKLIDSLNGKLHDSLTSLCLALCEKDLIPLSRFIKSNEHLKSLSFTLADGISEDVGSQLSESLRSNPKIKNISCEFIPLSTTTDSSLDRQGKTKIISRIVDNFIEPCSTLMGNRECGLTSLTFTIHMTGYIMKKYNIDNVAYNEKYFKIKTDELAQFSRWMSAAVDSETCKWSHSLTRIAYHVLYHGGSDSDIVYNCNIIAGEHHE
ncbi:uncharacterized protein [Ptychodera flava]|uniref:uncharacterized protein n=1 Tax=Ptychodera flava TaxID=63121 RepID=UPI00396AA955